MGFYGKNPKSIFLSFFIFLSPHGDLVTWMGLCLEVSVVSHNALQVSVSFEDVTVDFSREEWQHLDSAQRRLYQDVMLKTTATSSHWVSPARMWICKEPVRVKFVCPRIYVNVLNCTILIVTLFRNMIFPEVIKLKQGH